MDNLGSLDLNLLRTLNVLLAERNVTRAAERLHLSQPSVSVQLARLREIFEDPLLLPGPRGMLPTARADALREPLLKALQELNAAVAPATPFDPAQAVRTWTIGATDYSEPTVLLPAMPAIRSAAPNVRLAVVQVVPRLIEKQCALGELDLVFHTAHDAPETLHRKTLFKERYVLVGRPDHPGLRRRPSAAQFSKLDQVIVSPDGGGFTGATDEALAQRGLRRRVMLSVPHFTFVRAVVLRTDLVAMLPERLVRGDTALKIMEAPVEVPGYEMALLWHERSQRDPAHRWLRETIAAACERPGA